ncbi:PD-(D/E)XK nuclease family protein [Caloramator sp. mosi_1]|uniref:PD-(D/E)XK nuclease family protein n=1 Tax=Caloramator sp. mosi_1 TaxID=3023090 RepID=UPI00235E132E|nr:PD-(D/E)XK nuclease family protein [Caloramator sp. mosi_1]WDC84788.1 PD-(D/E)XK nuclease family protein [Caloramator sp. mosi_1]
MLTPDLIRGTSYDYVFIMGLNEGKFPKLSKASGIYTTREKEIIYRLGVNFGSSIFEMEKEKIRFILSIASSREGLILSYRTSGEDGAYISKSQFLDEVIYKLRLHKAFEGRKVRTMRDRFNLNKIYSKPELIKRYCITKDSRIDNIETNYLEEVLMIEEKRNSDEFTEYDGLIDINKMKDSNKKDVFSASKIMSYNKCPFKYFIENVLNIRKWEEDIYSNLNYGNIYHYVLENYYRDYIEKELEYKEDRIEQLSNEGFKNYGLVLDDNYTYIINQKLLDNIKKFIKIDVSYKNEIKFRPYLIEQDFEIDDLIEGIKIKGRIDRVDVEYDGDNPTGRYIIQDYKISNAKGLSDMLKGDAIQVVLYYYVVNKILTEKLGKTPECVGLVYYDINDTVNKNKKQLSGIIVAKDKKN